jgi:hypothetical protein
VGSALNLSPIASGEFVHEMEMGTAFLGVSGQEGSLPNGASTFNDQFADFSARIGMACGVKTFRS